jgi:hypothetical protein
VVAACESGGLDRSTSTAFVLVEGADGGPPAEREERLRHALPLWRGPVLADFAGEPFAQAFIAELDELKRATEARLAQF